MRRMLAMIACGLTALVAAGCANQVQGRALLPANLPDPTKDIFYGADPCSLLPDEATGGLGLTKFGIEDTFGPVCVYETENGADDVNISFMLRKDVQNIPEDSLGPLTDTTVDVTPAKERRHPSNAGCTLYLEFQRPTLVSIGVSTRERTQDESCELTKRTAQQVLPVIEKRSFTPYQPPDDSARPGGNDPCGLLTNQQAGKLRLQKVGPSEDEPEDECDYTARGGNQVSVGYSSPGGVATAPGEPTDITVGGAQAQEKRQPYNTGCTIVLLPGEEAVVQVVAGGPPQFPQAKNCQLATKAAEQVTRNLG